MSIFFHRFRSEFVKRRKFIEYSFLIVNKRQYSIREMGKSALILLAPGAEEMEFVIAADVLRRCGTFDAVVLPGGLGGAKALADSKVVGDLLQKQEKSGRICAAICAGPTAFLSHSIGLGKKLTSYPSVKGELAGKYTYMEENVVVDGNIVTSRGPGTAFDFGLKLGELLVGAEVSKDAASKMLL
uniref:CSON006746 protein n=1 Tax=Culicoides sonorensis TaxID=179676 RepID=A0A336LX85_CULSO